MYRPFARTLAPIAREMHRMQHDFDEALMQRGEYAKHDMLTQSCRLSADPHWVKADVVDLRKLRTR